MSGQVTEREAERKYSGAAGVPVPATPTLGTWTAPRRFRLRAEYFDTPQLDLNRAGWTLRRRTGGDDAGWHLKSPAGEGVRIERRLPLDAGVGRVPAGFRAELGDLVAGRPLIPIALLETDRAELDLVSGGRVRAHLCSDDVTASAGGGSQSWHEIEAELVPDEPLATLDALDAALLGSGCTPAPYGSKVGRAIARLTPAPRPWVGSPAGDIVLAYAAKQVGTLQSVEEGVRADAPDAVHKSRVAARRLRSALRRFGPLLDAEYVGGLVNELRWYGEVAGAPRDAEVLKEHLLAALADLEGEVIVGPVAGRLVAELEAAHATAHARLVTELDGARYAALHRALADLLVARPLRDVGLLPGEFVLFDLVEAAVRRVRRRYARALALPDHLELWHEVRKAAKAVRYCCDSLADPCGTGAAATARRWEAVTEALGDVQDTVVAHTVLGDLARHAAERGEQTITYRVLQQRQLGKRATALASGIEAVEAALADQLDWLR